MGYLDDMALAGAILGFSEEKTDEMMDSGSDFDELLYERFGVDLEMFSKIADALLEFTPTVSSPLTGKVSHAFVRQMGGGNCCAIVQREASPQKG